MILKSKIKECWKWKHEGSQNAGNKKGVGENSWKYENQIYILSSTLYQVGNMRLKAKLENLYAATTFWMNYTLYLIRKHYCPKKLSAKFANIDIINYYAKSIKKLYYNN